MSRFATIAIVGRPNVGKSTLFNRLVGKRLALVDDQPGVTRDRREGDGHLLGLDFRIVDTAGFEDYDAATLPGRMRVQTEKAVREADAALFMIDGRAGVTPLDEEIARWLRSEDTPIILVVNKAEGKQGENGLMESYSLGFDNPIALSAEHGEGVVDLFDALRPIVDAFDAAAFEAVPPRVEGDEEDEDAPLGPLKLAIVGRPNAGKSTLINRMIGEDRLITGPEAGITRDSIRVDWQWEKDGEVHEIQLFDTAGMRKRAKVVEKLEKLSVADALHAVDFAEVVVLLLDATKGLESQDLHIADRVLQEGRALIVALNKWDVAEDPSSLFNGVRTALEDGLSQVKGVPVLSISGATGKGIDTLVRVAFEQRAIWTNRVSTAKLNRWFENAVENNPPPAPGGKRIKLRYITQARTRPPTFVVFGTRTDSLPGSYTRYLVNGMRKELGFQGVPVRLNFRNSRNPYDE
ncbi:MULTISPECIES: ribosome biogenesis GTPase Der [unclassified Sphingopyxis]|uniref:ribosome biogenesis GTPase Der n=1 Tax=unclassified Sphingopyxis TaxID=2614943 RepID=UPI0007311CD5|nr:MULTISPECIES: ribosome biogenesis GTPase Der [unclassified Sphingopyxis]KTE01386.1 ribosome-associated GTPase EngA [Sphingopyxis sp. H012]KTE07516.1 ribosome-associated GTPase EngA [Sphingopyxis sp. H093]KTE12687.1 ribosome-associated GTPase EngA [Sphingopyxis sp. H053]KTE24852.1 ribosome-associated GTPase EngA [Sphingopyxis sp. H080]KTE31942.1 ribosome-associated GTPase EngA [Sphingopyxis sp. H038]